MWFLPKKLYDPFLRCSCKIFQQVKIIISPLPQFLWPPKLTRILIYINKVTWLTDHVVLQDAVTTYNHYFYIITMYMATKFGRVVACLKGVNKVIWINKVIWVLSNLVFTRSRDKLKMQYFNYHKLGWVVK